MMGPGLRQLRQMWSCHSSVGQCCGCVQVHEGVAGGWQRLSEDTGDTLVKDTVIAGPWQHNQWGGESQAAKQQRATEKSKESGGIERMKKGDTEREGHRQRERGQW